MSLKGSEWRKWDLHIHSPETALNNQFKGKNLDEKWKNYIDEIEKLEDIKVLGITDYFSIDGYLKMMEYKNKGRLQNIELLLPNVELRLMPATCKAKAINYHVIFSPDIIKNIDSLFFSKLEFGMGGNKYSCLKSELVRLGRDFTNNEKLDKRTAYVEGITQFKVNVDSINEILGKNDLLRNNAITVVANSNQDGVSGLQQQNGMQAGRRNIYFKADMIFSGNPNDREFFVGNKTSKELVIKECGNLKACIHGSDAHSLDKICKPDKDRFTWIKADTNFNGLKQVLYEPEHRVYIGVEPPLFDRLRREPECFIEKISINNIKEYDGKDGIWFKDIIIPLNKELVAIIGNKGKGKSAVADIIGLLGNSKNHQFFNFLNNNKFRKEKGKKAKNFTACLTRKNLPEITKGLNDDVDNNSVELVKYIPQSFFEKITNNLDESFEKEINNVIFSHINEGDIYIDFDDLMNKKTATINDNISKLSIEINSINTKIIELEKKAESDYLESLKSKLKEQNAILNSIKKPSNVLPPSVSSKDEENNSKLDELNKELSKVINDIENITKEKTGLVKEKLEVVSAEDKLTSLEQYVENFVKNNQEQFSNLGIEITNVVNFKLNRMDLDHTIALIENRLLEIEPLLIKVESADLNQQEELYENSLYFKKLLLEKRVKEISQKLAEPNRLYQQYLVELKNWEIKKKEVIGSKDSTNTIKYLENEIDYIENGLQMDIDKERLNRLSKCEKIFMQKENIIEIYNKIKVAIDKFIEGNNDNLNEFKISLDAGYKIKESFFIDFFDYIDGSKKGSFRGNNKEILTDIFNIDIKDFDDIKCNLESIVEHLEIDKRENQNLVKRDISSQILKGKHNKFYNFLYTLDYIVPSYSLKLDTKSLNEISPGEKGALLLVFYLLLDRSKMPLIIDQPEDNLDNQSIFNILVPFIKKAKSKRQTIMVTHNPNLAVVADAEQIIYVDIDKKHNHKFKCISGSIENPNINKEIVRILEGTMPAFESRELKYLR
ncbi:hypothetical protein RBH29_11165 [Herbivorax sp. ANBcel31]|uniref:TrlF family AAA-like ATPase n=1 Tax=Herbivorax sp. ANBcel31 TaxID=3069754 RepID=UPI0027AFDAB8|nr:AAA family ATPase [Herbivorax sp. ANBcel31]MDQ2086987.1 hypothetical protein [Herbivorax sp. ANBcel31]